MHDWMVDNGFTPHIVVDASRDGLRVPPGHVQDGKIVLNVSPSATHALALGNDVVTFEARFNGDETTKFSEEWSAPARVAALSDGNCVGRRGIYAGTRLALGPCAALAIGGITVVVVSHRVQCADPVFFEMMGLDIARARSVAVKSRGHFRGGFDEFFGPDRIVEVDLPGLTSPMLARFAWTRLPRPVIPLDDGVEFSLR